VYGLVLALNPYGYLHQISTTVRHLFIYLFT
jgi:hypothetical protein